MQNEELIKALRKYAENAQKNNEFGTMRDFDAAADALEAADKAQMWIPASERLPEDAGSYLVYYHEWSNGDFLPKYDDYRTRVMRFMNNGKWCMPVCTDKRCEADTNREVTDWRKLPKPPQKGE